MAGAELVLHAGVPQTASGVLQRALSRLRPQLRRHGVAFVGHRALSKLESLDGWACRDGADPAASDAFEREVDTLVQREQAAAARQHDGVRATLIASDHLLGARNLGYHDERCFRPHAAAATSQIIRAVGADRVRVVLHTRRQDRLMELAYLRAVQNGATHALERQFPARFEPRLDYHELAGRLEGLAAVEEVRVRPVERVGAGAAGLAADVLAALGLHDRLDLAPVGSDLAPAPVYSHRAMRLALDVNPHLETDAERRRVRRFLLEHFPADDDAGTRVLAEPDRRRVLEAYAAANRGLFERYLPDLPPDAYASDDATAELAAAGGLAPAVAAAGRPARPRRGLASGLERARALARSGSRRVGALAGRDGAGAGARPGTAGASPGPARRDPRPR